jgi:hypothetical protein
MGQDASNEWLNEPVWALRVGHRRNWLGPSAKIAGRITVPPAQLHPGLVCYLGPQQLIAGASATAPVYYR